MKYTPEEIKAHRQQWIEALRSGKYAQASDYLCRLDEHDEPVGHCCLGVAAELAGLPATAARNINGEGYRRYENQAYYLPHGAAEWLGVRSDNPLLADATNVAKMNDDGRSFAEIADAIEQIGFAAGVDVLVGA